MPEIVVAPLGLTFTSRTKLTFTVAAKGDGCTRGHWHCVTCDESFANNLGKDLHCQGRPRRNGRLVKEKNHALTWLCYEHDTAELP